MSMSDKIRNSIRNWADKRKDVVVKEEGGKITCSIAPPVKAATKAEPWKRRPRRSTKSMCWLPFMKDGNAVQMDGTVYKPLRTGWRYLGKMKVVPRA